MSNAVYYFWTLKCFHPLSVPPPPSLRKTKRHQRAPSLEEKSEKNTPLDATCLAKNNLFVYGNWRPWHQQQWSNCRCVIQAGCPTLLSPKRIDLFLTAHLAFRVNRKHSNPSKPTLPPTQCWMSALWKPSFIVFEFARLRAMNGRYWKRVSNRRQAPLLD